MATITSAQTGNFSSTSTWVGGVVPGASDDAVAATGHVVTIDVDVTVISVQQAGTGKFVLGNGRKLTGNVIANAGTFTSGGTVEVTATTGNTATINGNVTGVSTTANNTAGIVITGTGTLTVNGSVTGSPGGNSSEANGSSAIYTNVTCTVNINGAITNGGAFKSGFRTGTSSNVILAISGTVTVTFSASAILVAGTSPNVTVVGDVLCPSGSGVSFGIQATGTSSVIAVTGNVTGGGNGTAIGIAVAGASATTTVTGNITGGSSGPAVSITGTSAVTNIIGNSTGGTGGFGVAISGANAVTNVTGNLYGAGTHGLSSSGGASLVTVVGNLFGGQQSGHGLSSAATTANCGVVLTGNMTDSSLGATALYGRILRLVSTPSGITTYTNNVGYPNGGSVTRVSPDNVTGMPAASNVRSGLTYGYNNQLTGQAVIPPASSVAAGTEVDNTVGTAALDIGALVSVVGAQIAAASTTPVVN